jgi:hypothetical protein
LVSTWRPVAASGFHSRNRGFADLHDLALLFSGSGLETTQERTPEAGRRGGPDKLWMARVILVIFLGVQAVTQTWRLRAAGVAGVWVLACLPLRIGRSDCPLAEIFGVPCPGCGMTRAALLLVDGQWTASLRMHPLSLPNAIGSLFFMGATIWVTAKSGSPITMWSERVGRAAILSFGTLQLAMLGLWLARMFGFFGGPVPV